MLKLGRQLLKSEYIVAEQMNQFLSHGIRMQDEYLEPYILPKNIVFIDNIKELQENIQSHPAEIQLLHSLIHIEYNAIKAYIDTVLRFNKETIRRQRVEFANDMKSIIEDEFNHYTMLSQFVTYGQLPVHNNLQKRILQSSDSLQGRLAVLSIVNEGRGMDTGEGIIQKLLDLQKNDMAEVVKKIVKDESRHVEIGLKWFERLARKNPHIKFMEYMQKYDIKCTWKINYQKRKQAGYNDKWLETFKQWK